MKVSTSDEKKTEGRGGGARTRVRKGIIRQFFRQLLFGYFIPVSLNGSQGIN